MSVLPVAESPEPDPDPDPFDWRHPRLRPRDPLFRTATDPALRVGRPDTVHIAPRKRWFT